METRNYTLGLHARINFGSMCEGTYCNLQILIDVCSDSCHYRQPNFRFVFNEDEDEDILVSGPAVIDDGKVIFNDGETVLRKKDGYLVLERETPVGVSILEYNEIEEFEYQMILNCLREMIRRIDV